LTAFELQRFVFWLFLQFASSYFLTFIHTSTYGKVFTAIGIFLLELLVTEYFTHLPRSPERSKMTCACSEGCFLKKVVKSFGVFLVTMKAVTQQWSNN